MREQIRLFFNENIVSGPSEITKSDLLNGELNAEKRPRAKADYFFSNFPQPNHII